MTSRTQEERYAAFVHEQSLAFEASQRMPSFIITTIIVVLAVPLMLLAPGAEGATGMSFAKTMIADVVMAVVIAVTSGVYYRLGVASRLYVVLEMLETWVVQLGIGYVIASSGDGDNFYWFFYVVHILALAMRPVFSWLHVAPMVATPLMVFVWLVIDKGATTDVFFALAAGMTGLVLFSYGAGFQKKILTHAFACNELEAELSALKVAAERTRIARDLHDGVTADLTAMAWRAEELAGRGAGPTADLRELGARARAAIDDTRAVVWALEGKALPWARLCDQVASRCEQLCSGEVRLSTRLARAALDQIDGGFALDILRIIQEAVRNAVQHADAESITVSLSCEASSVAIMVEDDGIGMQRSDESLASGLVNLRERVRARGGEIKISERNPGTRVAITLPALS